MFSRPILLTVLFFEFFLTSFSIPDWSQKPVIIDNDTGGIVGEYDQKFKQMEASNASFEIKGYCYSACGRYMKLSHVCAQPGSKFGFHSVYNIRTEKLMPKASLEYSMRRDTSYALAIEERYQSYNFGWEKSVPVTWEEKEPGIAVYISTYTEKDKERHQKFLMVDADKIIRSCAN